MIITFIESLCSASTQGSCLSVNESVAANHRDFKILVDNKSGTRHCIHLVAPTVQDKEAWISDISQCLDNIHLHSMLSPGIGGGSGGSLLAAHQALKADPRLFKDDVDIRFSRTLNSCKLPQVRYATPERLLQRLTDLRFLSIDFLNTFLLTYRVFTDGETVLNALKKVFYEPPIEPQCEHQTDFLDIPGCEDGRQSPRRTSGASSVSGYCSEGADRDRSLSCDSTGTRFRGSRRLFQQQSTQEEGLSWIPESNGTHTMMQSKILNDKNQDSIISVISNIADSSSPTTNATTESSPDGKQSDAQKNEGFLSIPKTTIATSCSTDTLTENTLSAPSSPSNLSSVTLVGSTGSGGLNDKFDETTPTDSNTLFKYGKAPTSPLPERVNTRKSIKKDSNDNCNKNNGNDDVADSPSHPKNLSIHPTVTMMVTSSAGANQEVITDDNLTQNNTKTSPLKSAISPPSTNTMLGFDRRPSVGCNVIPHAALCQHRHSLQMNGEGVFRVNLCFILH